MELLKKFAQVEVKNETRVSKDDIEFCEKQEESYRISIKALEKVREVLRGVMDRYGSERPGYYNHEQITSLVYLNESDDIEFVEKRITALKRTFVVRICRHFEKKYNITLNSTAMMEKYDSTITYQDIIDEMFLEFDGMNFEEKAVQELKDFVKERLTIYPDKITVKNKKLTLHGITNIDYYSKRWGSVKLHYGSRDNAYALFKGLSHFEYGTLDTCHPYSELQRVWSNGEGGAVFSKHEVNGEKVLSVKPFQNGKVEINFETRELAIEFAAEYLGHA